MTVRLEDLVDAKEAAALLGLRSDRSLHSFLWRRREAGRPITTYRINGRLRFLPSDLAAAFTVERAKPSMRRAG